jgi:hypothetical protein
MKKHIKIPVHLYTLGKAIGVVSALLTIFMAFLPWGAAVNEKGQDSLVMGLQGDGKITLVLGAIAIILLISKRCPHIFAAILGIIVAIIAYIDIWTMNQVVTEMTAYIGYGLYFTLAGGIGIFFGGILEMSKK